MEHNWRESILNNFTRHMSLITLVADPDYLVNEESILNSLREKGFEILFFNDPIDFRFAYESLYRVRWDNGETVELIVIINDATRDIQTLPYDLLQKGNLLSFGLRESFPNLSYPIIKLLNSSELDILYDAQMKHHPERMGKYATQDFILKHVFSLDTDSIHEPAELLHILLRRMYSEQQLPLDLENRFIQQLRHNGMFQQWPLEQIIHNRQIFLRFLQERWPIYLKDAAAKQGRVYETALSDNFTVAGPANLPFGHNLVRAYIDTLFLDRKLHPVALPYQQTQSFLRENRWECVGIQNNTHRQQVLSLERLIESVEKALPEDDAKYQTWQKFAPRWSELIVCRYEQQEKLSYDIEQKLKNLQEKADNVFLKWVKQRYNGLHNLPAMTPIMVHHITQNLANEIQQHSKKKVALIILDGMSFDQWVVLKEVMQQQRTIDMQEEAVFAWVPTITVVSRQSIFAGKSPLYFAESITTTNKEESHWQHFWKDKNLSSLEVGYKRSINDHRQLPEIENLLSHPKKRVVGLVVDTIDKISHGMQLGTAGMHTMVRQWAAKGFVIKLLELLSQYQYAVYITSDHGNIEANGNGRPNEGAIAEQRGERVRIYNDTALRNQVYSRFPESITWNSPSLPKDYLPLLASDRKAFVTKGETIVGHGGITIEELIIPYIQIRSIQQ